MDLIEGLLSVSQRATPRGLTDDDVDSFMRSARRRKPIRQRASLEAVCGHFKRKHTLRIRKMKSDIKWFEKECARFGYDPRDVLDKL